MAAAAEITETLVGTAGASSPLTSTGQGLKCGIYSFTKATLGDWVIFSDFTKILYASADYVATGTYTDEGITVDVTTLNKVTFGSANTGTIRVMVVGY
jgi:hypothetical protein